MPRRPRINLADVPQHIVQRGINREPCFFADEDYHCYLHWLQKSAVDWRCSIHAYVLMTNHVHLLLTPEQPEGVAKLMQSIGRRYVQYINRTYKRSGTLWEGRFRSCLTQTEEYVLACYRYIELNPVRAGMGVHPRDYRWTSYHANAQGKVSRIIQPHEQYQRLGGDDEARQIAYRALFKAHLDEETVGQIRNATNGQSGRAGKDTSVDARQGRLL